MEVIGTKNETDGKKARENSSHQSESLLSTQPTDKDSSSSVENLITTPKRQQSKGSAALSLIEKTKKVAEKSIMSSAQKSLNNGPMKTGLAKKGKDDPEEKEENITQHGTISTNH